MYFLILIKCKRITQYATIIGIFYPLSFHTFYSFCLHLTKEYRLNKSAIYPLSFSGLTDDNNSIIFLLPHLKSMSVLKLIFH